MRSIDVHAHLTPQCFWRATENGGDWHSIRRERDANGHECAVVGGRRQALPPRARWTPEERLADMDSLGVDVHVVSPYVGFYNYHLDAKLAAATAQATNDEISAMTRAWPRRFAGLGTLPMQDVKAAIGELERCMTGLGLKGVEINDHVNGRTLDDAEFRPFWKAAEQLGALIFFHQGGETLVTPRTTRYHLPNTIGNLVDRAVTFATLVSGGVMDECPDLKICLGHGGGYTCYGIGRMDHGWQARAEARAHITKPPSAYLRRFYYDCIVYTEPALRFLIDTVGADRVVFGTDWPYDMALDWPVAWILGMQSLSQEEKEAILWRNLERVLNL
ncbi:MAG TPA: amidohydrolase family protein [Methylomirabilota bacterium]|jgi:aminocarboxymuconate-semialdehyde decarboxylase|nr:amidohydrolase family protein [Methylomirabilota bacterium]